MGPSGSGKSTFMNMLGCLDRPSSGEYVLGSRRVSDLAGDELAEVRNSNIGFVFQTFNLLARTSAVENVELPLVYAGVPSAERRVRALEMLGKVGLAERADHHPAQLSGGQQQRVAIARALVTRPLLILADEPTGALDSRTSLEIMGLLQELNHGGMTVVLVTHEADVARFARRVLRFRDGHLVEDHANDASRRRAGDAARGAGAGMNAQGERMNVLGLLRVAMRALAVNKLRSVLTMLGIIIGVAAVIVMIAVGAGAQKRVEEQIRSLGSNLLLILSGTTTSGGVRMGFGSNLTISEDDAAAIPREIPETMAAPALRGTAQLIWGNQNWSTVIFGVTPEYIDVRQWETRRRAHLRRHRHGGRDQGLPGGPDRGAAAVRRRRSARPGDPRAARALHRDRRARIQGPEHDGLGPGRPHPDADQHRPQARARRLQPRQAAQRRHDLGQGGRRLRHEGRRGAGARAAAPAAPPAARARTTISRCATWRKSPPRRRPRAACSRCCSRRSPRCRWWSAASAS